MAHTAKVLTVLFVLHNIVHPLSVYLEASLYSTPSANTLTVSYSKIGRTVEIY